MHNRVVIVVATFILGSAFCVAAVWWHFDLGHDGVEALSELHGEPMNSVLKELGTPTTQLEYSMEKCPGGELRCPLYNTYPPNDPAAMKARILEMNWHRHSYSIAVWLHQVNGAWVVLDTCRWQKNVRF